MLAGHSELNAPPELHLIGFNSLKSRERLLVDSGGIWRLYGLMQTLASQMNMSEDQAFAMLTKLTAKDIPIYRIYELIHSTSKKSVLVDKSPGILTKKPRLYQAEQMFKLPKYIHLVRHPGAVIESWERMRHIIKHGEDGVCRDRGSRLKVREAAWRFQNRNALEFLSGIQRERHIQVLYEDLVRDSRVVMHNVADFIGVDFDNSMLDPYAGDRLIAGIGDPNITSRDKVDSRLADAWEERLGDYSFDTETVELAGRLGVTI
jgi:hypothetical protein